MAQRQETRRARREEATTLPPAERAREIALRILTNGPRSTAQLREGLLSRDVPEDVAGEVVARYVEVGLLDDAALSATIARTRYAERGVAPRVIEQELLRKGFSRSDIDAALAPFDSEAQLAAAAELAARRWARLEGQEREVRVRRVVAHLGRKGYPPSLAFALVKDLHRADIEKSAESG